MANKSVFIFLKEDYEDIYEHCMTVEKLIKDEDYRVAIFTCGMIAEDVAKIISKRVPQKKQREYNEIHNKKPDFERIIQICENLNLFHNNHNKNKSITRHYTDLRRLSNSARHDKDYQFNLNKARQMHKALFIILVEYYNSIEVAIDPKYSFDLSYLSENKGIELNELKYIVENITQNSVSKNELKQFMENQNQFITKEMLKSILTKHENNLINKEELVDYLNSKNNLITESDVEKIVKTYFDKTVDKEDIKKELSEFSTKSEVIELISEITKDNVSLDDVQELIDESTKSIRPIVEDSIREIITNHFKTMQKEMDKINLIKTDSSGESIFIDIPNYEIREDDDTFYLKEVKEELDTYQKQAVEYDGDDILVIDAGPGAGKTRVIVERVVYLVNVRKVEPSSLLVITFTNKAADELKERLKRHAKLTIEQVNQMRISTIHSFCRYILTNFENIPYNFLNRHGERGLFIQKHKLDLGFKDAAFIPDSELVQVYTKYDEYITFGLIPEKLISYIKGKTHVKPEYESYINDFYSTHDYNWYPNYKEIDMLNYKKSMYNSRYLQIAESYEEFLDLMDSEHVADHNFLLLKANEILDNEETLHKIPYTNILIDEFQDTDNNQLNLFQKLLKIKETFTIVGDADQSIYGFRGSDPTIFTKWAKDERTKTITLKNNYRSTKNIVQFNEKLIEEDRETDKELRSVNTYKMPVYHIYSQKNTQQALNIVKIIQHLKKEEKIKYYSDVGILVRKGVSTESTRAILEELNNAGIPYYLKGINDLMEQDEVKAILTLIWYLLPQDNFYLRKYEDEWLNLFGFTDVVYNSSKIFKLSKRTMKNLEFAQQRYQKQVMKKERDIYYRKEGKSSKIKNFRGVFNRSQEVITEIFKNVVKPDLSILTEEQLLKLGITKGHDLEFFKKLNKLKKEYNHDYYSMTTLQIFSKLLSITGYLDELVVRNDNEAKRALMNIGLVSDIISDYEKIMGEYNLKGLFKYLSGILNSYSCPINDIEDNTHKVHVMTIHKSKGLEFPVVIVVSLQEDSFPKYFDENAKTGDYDYYDNPNYYTPNYCLKYKPNSVDIEAQQYNQEENRVVYVATTRAKELLILSTLYFRKRGVPQVLQKAKQKYRGVEKLELENLDRLQKVKTKTKKNKIEILPTLKFEEIIDDYIFCPIKYKLKSLNYKTPKNNEKFIDRLLHTILISIYSPDRDTKPTKEDVMTIIMGTLKSYSLNNTKIHSKEYKPILNIVNYWNDYGQNYEVIKSNLSVTQRLKNCDLNANIDLIVKENEEEISIVKFISSTDKNIDYLSYYKDLLNYYATFINGIGEFKDKKIRNVYLHSLKDNEKYCISHDPEKQEMITTILDNLIKEIIDEEFVKKEVNCSKCGFKGITCK